VRQALVDAGIIFISENELGGPGVRWQRRDKKS
jgi:hypothetical protein